MPEVEISAMTFGPYALAHIDGQAVMVPHAAPGDRLEIEIRSRRRDYATASVRRLITAGPHRRTAPCRYLPRCGGCDWQHLDYPAQLRAKGELIAAALGRALEVKLDADRLVEPAPQEFAYRSRLRLKIGPGGQLGFYQFGTNVLVAIDECLVAVPGLAIPHEFARSLGRRLREIEVVAAADCNILVAHLARAPGADEIDRARRAIGSGGIKGVVLRSETSREVVGDVQLTTEIEPTMELRADADVFSQVNHAQNRKLVAAVMEMAAIEEGTAVLDLFCGAGNFSLPAARRGARVTGVDSDKLAIAAAAQNAARMNFQRINFLAMKARDAAQFLLRARYHPQLVILDPPRPGAADVMELIGGLKARSVIYVACDVPALARDLRMLHADGYRAERVRAFDFFPNTHHAEVAAHLLLT